MCLSPIVIRNRSKVRAKALERPTFVCGCGHCPECREKKQNDYFVRAWLDWEQFSRSHLHSSVHFITLTYTKESVPYIVRDVVDPETGVLQRNHRVLVPDFRDVQKFLKTLRKRLKESMFYCDDNPDMRYICTSEYGSKLGRPHFHLIIMIDRELDSAIFRNFAEYSWQEFKYVHDEKGHIKRVPVCTRGRISDDRIKADKSEREFWRCFEYVCKYSTKDVAPFSNFDGSSYNNVRVRASIGFGYNDTLITDAVLKNGFIYFPFGKNGTPKKYFLPSFYINCIRPSLLEELKKNASYDELLSDLRHDITSYATLRLNADVSLVNNYYDDLDISKLDSKTISEIRCQKDYDRFFDLISSHVKSEHLAELYLSHCKGDDDKTLEFKEFKLYDYARNFCKSISTALDYEFFSSYERDLEEHGIFQDSLRSFFSQIDITDLYDYIVHIRSTIKFRQSLDINTDFPFSFWKSFANGFSYVENIDAYDLYEKLCLLGDYYNWYIKSFRYDISQERDFENQKRIEHKKNLKYLSYYEQKKRTGAFSYHEC